MRSPCSGRGEAQSPPPRARRPICEGSTAATVAPLFVRDDGELTRCEPLFYNGSRIHRVYPLMGGGVAEWLKAAVC